MLSTLQVIGERCSGVPQVFNMVQKMLPNHCAATLSSQAFGAHHFCPHFCLAGAEKDRPRFAVVVVREQTSWLAEMAATGCPASLPHVPANVSVEDFVALATPWWSENKAKSSSCWTRNEDDVNWPEGDFFKDVHDMRHRKHRFWFRALNALGTRHAWVQFSSCDHVLRKRVDYALRELGLADEPQLSPRFPMLVQELVAADDAKDEDDMPWPSIVVVRGKVWSTIGAYQRHDEYDTWRHFARVVDICDFEDATLADGVCHAVWDTDYLGMCSYNNRPEKIQDVGRLIRVAKTLCERTGTGPILDTYDMCDRAFHGGIRGFGNLAKAFGTRLVLHKLPSGCKEFDQLRDACPEVCCRLFYSPHAIPSRYIPLPPHDAFPHSIHGACKDIDVLHYGNRWSAFYPVRADIVKSLQHIQGLNVVDGSSDGSISCRLTRRALFAHISRAWLCVATSSTRRWLLARYFEIPASGTVMVGNSAAPASTSGDRPVAIETQVHVEDPACAEEKVTKALANKNTLAARCRDNYLAVCMGGAHLRWRRHLATVSAVIERPVTERESLRAWLGILTI